LFEVARRFQMEVQPQLVLLQKTLLNIEGLGRELYPELDLWKTGKPFLQRWVKERLGPKGIVNYARRNLSRWAMQFPALTNTLLSTPERIERLELIQAQQTKALQNMALESKKRRYTRHIGALLGLSGLLISGAVSMAEYEWLAGHWPLIIAALSFVLILRR
jgi:ubiquinone biosynthesis protein